MKEFIFALQVAQNAYPNQRVGQILINATNCEDYFYWSNARLTEALYSYVALKNMCDTVGVPTAE